MSWKNPLPALKVEIRGLFRATGALVARSPKSHDPVVVWFDEQIMVKFVNSLPREDRYADLKNNAAATRKIFYNLIQDPYYLRAAIKLVYIIRSAPEPPVPEWMREWIETHFGKNAGGQ